MFQQEYWERDTLDRRRAPDHPVIREYVLPKIRMIRETVAIGQETLLLDVGCGNGFFSRHLDPLCRVFAVDFSHKMLSLNPVQRKCRMDGGNLGFQDNSFDIVFCHALLHHVENIDQVICEMARVSRRYVIILEPNRTNPLMFLFSLLVKEERKALRFSRRYLKKITAANGLQVKAAFSAGMIVPNKMPAGLLFLARWLGFKQPLGMTNFIIAEKP